MTLQSDVTNRIKFERTIRKALEMVESDIAQVVEGMLEAGETMDDEQIMEAQEQLAISGTGEIRIPEGCSREETDEFMMRVEKLNRAGALKFARKVRREKAEKSTREVLADALLAYRAARKDEHPLADRWLELVILEAFTASQLGRESNPALELTTSNARAIFRIAKNFSGIDRTVRHWLRGLIVAGSDVSATEPTVG